jgi:hypothetical protein
VAWRTSPPRIRLDDASIAFLAATASERKITGLHVAKKIIARSILQNYTP